MDEETNTPEDANAPEEQTAPEVLPAVEVQEKFDLAEAYQIKDHDQVLQLAKKLSAETFTEQIELRTGEATWNLYSDMTNLGVGEPYGAYALDLKVDSWVVITGERVEVFSDEKFRANYARRDGTGL